MAQAANVRARLQECITHLEHILPGQAPIRDFVHHNPLHGFQHLPFPEALAAAQRLTGGRVWLDENDCRNYHRQGRIDDGDLMHALEHISRIAGHFSLDAVLVAVEGRTITRREVLRQSLIHDLTPITFARFRWLVEEQGILREHGELWRACLEILAIDDAFMHPEELLELSAREEKHQAAAVTGQEDFAERADALWGELRTTVGAGGTLTYLLGNLTGEDALDAVRPMLLRHLAAHLDQGVAAWHNPARPKGFYAAWKCSARQDLAWACGELDDARDEITGLPADALETVIAELSRIGLPEEHWPGYLERLTLELPGWSGMFLWRHRHPDYAGTAGVPVEMTDFLAVRLVLERIVTTDIARRHWGIAASLPALGTYFRRHPAELWVRHAYGAGGLPEFLLELIEPHRAASGETALPRAADRWEWLAERIEAWRDTPTAEQTVNRSLTRSAWPLFQLSRHLGLDAASLRAIGRNGAETLLGTLRRLDVHQRGHLWLLAYERHYREQILAGLAANHGRWRGHATGPNAQLVFCMDDREEGMRRHLEEIAPEVETLGGAAHFAVFQNYIGLDDAQPTSLCPVIPEVIVPSHNVNEVARDEAIVARHRERTSLRRRWHERLNQATRHGLFTGLALTALAAPWALAGLLWRSLSPARFGDFFTRCREHFDLPVKTQLTHAAATDAGPATPQAPRTGFTDAEGAECIGNYLAAIGLTRDFAPLVAIVGHGSNSTNNPHMAAYDCGACAGRHSGPNARLFAALTNRPGVRAQLAQRGIAVPDGTWFLGAEHNTCDDLVTWYDLEDLPAALRSGFEHLDRQLLATARAHAQERCRRLFSAPEGIGPAAALDHVLGRRHDWSQARPELGHATNACAFIGRRALTRGAFFDRRSFLISYDPTQDPEGKVLERHLLINGAVGAGISLEYFFSTVSNEHFGCGSKITLNVAGYFGVMHGASSDLATGLPQQMIEVHEAMRLLVVVEQALAIITAVYQRQPPLQELVGNGWVIVAAKDPENGAIHLFDPQQGWLPWQPTVAIPTVKQSTDWFLGKSEPLPPVLLEKPLAMGAAV